MDLSHEFGRWISQPSPGEEVVISGVSGRFPESNNVLEFQENLFNKRDMVTDDDRRWKLDHPEIPRRSGKIYNIDKVDAGYFGLHYRQADIMDPMTRKMLECAIEAIMDAGVNPVELAGTKTAVCLGTCYADMEIETMSNIAKPQSFGVTGNLRSFMANRISYFLKLKSTSCILDTACSSSLNALELGFKSIRSGKCDYAIVGGASLNLHPGITRQFFRLGVLSTDGTCKVFDQRADGYVRGETIACIFLQKAKTAKRIYAEIIYSKVNCDGFKPSGITFPSIEMQRHLMNDIMRDSQVDASELSFLEAHGTGTEVGDPQEVEAIDGALAQKRTKPLLIGSVKCSVGHTEPSSGLNSLTKVLIALETGYIPPNIHLENIKQGLTGFEEARLIPVTELTKLDRDDAFIGINNFGFGGNNCHLLIQRHKKVKINQGLPKDDLPRLVCVSGRTEQAVMALLDDINKRPLDGEYIGLLHQIFKNDIPSHFYRGFTVVSKTGIVQTDFKQNVKRNPIHVILGSYKKSHKILGQHLMKFDFFRSIVNKINEAIVHELNINKRKYQIRSDADLEIFSTIVIQLGILEILHLLDLEFKTVHSDAVGKIVTAYYHKDITLEEAMQELWTQPKTTTVEKENLEKIVAEPKNSSERETCRNKLDIEKLSTACHNGFDFRYYQNQTNFQKSLILNLTDDVSDDDNCFNFAKNNDVLFLQVLGRLYLEGHSLQTYKLYPEVQFPVSRSTPMISPAILWNYRNTWYTYCFGETSDMNVTQQEYNLCVDLYEEQKFISGHVIDGRNLIPAAEYLQLVQRTLMNSFKKSEIDAMPFVFENCKFVRAVTLPKSGVVKLLVSIQKSTGNFEIVEKDFVVVTGRVYVPDDMKKHQTGLPESKINEEKTEFLEQDEIYRELSLRGYNYSGLFKGVVKCNVDATAALVKWENNWTAFIDNMLQIKILEIDTRSLYVPVGFRKISINSLRHMQFTNAQEDSLCPVYNYKTTNILKSGGIEIHGLQATAILKKKLTSNPVLEKNVFVPNYTKRTLQESLRIITQIILENSLESNFKSVEILDDYVKENSVLLSPWIEGTLNDLPSITANLIVSSKKKLDVSTSINVENVTLTSTSNLLLLVATKIFERTTLLNQALNALGSGGFLLTREEVSFVPQNVENLEVITEHVTGSEKLVLMKKSGQTARIISIEISSNNFDWLPTLQKCLKEDADVVIHCQNLELEGMLGFANCIRREPKGNKVRCFFMMDAAPRFDITNPFYQTQLKKQMAMNVYKDQKWGTYRHLRLDEIQELEGAHFFVHNTVKGDLSSLKWFEGALSVEAKMQTDSVLVFPYYTSLNFKDIMVASGRVSIDSFTRNRIYHEQCLGFEFCGRDSNGRHVMGMCATAGMATIVSADTDLLWEIPDHWSFEDASAVIVVYATVVTALLKEVVVKPGTSILIHSATGGIGLAAINVCLYHDCNIFVTVGTQEKRNYIKEHFPQIPESHIGNSRDLSFEEMINAETKSRGVDIVLNSLSEEKLRASVRCLAPGGHLLEIGKFDLGNDTAFNLSLLEKSCSYHGIMLDSVFSRKGDMRTWLMNTIHQGLKTYIKPLPRTVFKYDEVLQAYKYMTTGRHIGKVVIKIRDENITEPQKQVFTGFPRFSCDAEKSYIIVGGLGGFGLELADWLYIKGAKKLILVSRLGIRTGYQNRRIQILRSSGVTVQISTAKATTEEGCLEIINQANRLGPVDGIFNLAVVLKDALFEDQNEKSFVACLEPKAQATIHLDRISRQHCPQLKYFVVFSSLSCGRGNFGQTNYGMANSIMERICERRKNEGLPALAIQWGAIGDVGLVAKMQKENKQLVIGGTLQQKVSNCLEVLDTFLKQENPVVSSMVVAEKINKGDNFGSAADVVAYILGVKDIKSVGQHTSFAELGMDSIMGTEMIQILEKDFDIYITAKEVRNLTFAKLMELEAKQNEGKSKVVTAEKGIDFLLQYIPREDTSDLPIVEISKPISEESCKTVFLLPGVEGVFTGVEHLTGNLKAHVLGVQYVSHCDTSSAEEHAKMILPHIEAAAGDKSVFNIIGYSFGAIMAVELTALLEEKGFAVNCVLVEGAPRYLLEVLKLVTPVDNEKELQIYLLFKILTLVYPTDALERNKEKFLKCKDFDEIFELAKSQIPPELLQKQDLQKQAILSLYNRFKSVISYEFNHEKIKSQVHLFKAKFPMVADFAEDYQLSELSELPVKVSEVDGDHATILDQDQLSEEINRIIISQN